MASFSIANGASLSDAYELRGRRLRRVYLPAATEGVKARFQLSQDGVTYGVAQTTAGAEIVVTVTAGKWTELGSTLDTTGSQFVKIETMQTDGTTAQTQTGAGTVVFGLSAA
jgi:hypothetical protein